MEKLHEIYTENRRYFNQCRLLYPPLTVIIVSMKFRRTASSVFASVFLVLVMMLAVVFFRLSTFGMSMVRSMVRSFLPSGGNGIEISADGMESTLMRSVTVNGIRVRIDGREVLSVPSVDVSMTIWDIVRMVLWNKASAVSLTVNDPVVMVDDAAIGKLQDLIGSLGSSSTEAASSEGGMLGNVGLSATVRNLSVSADYHGLSLQASGINATAETERGLVFSGADINLPQVRISGDLYGGGSITVDDIRGSVDSDFGTRLSIASASYYPLAWLSDLSAVSTLSRDSLYVAVYANDASADLNEVGMDADFKVNGATFSLNYGLRTGYMSVTANLDEAGGRYESVAFNLKSVLAQGSYDGSDEMKTDVSVGSVDGSYGSYSLNSSGITAKLSHDTSVSRTLGQVEMADIGVSGLETFGVSVLKASGFFTDFSYSQSGFDVYVRSAIDGHHDSAFIGDFHADVDAVLQTGNFRRIDYASAEISNLHLAAIPDSADLILRLSDDRRLFSSFTLQDDISGSLSYRGGHLDLNLFMTRLVPYRYPVLYDAFLSNPGVVGDATSFSGNMVLSTDFATAFSSWMADMLEGKYGHAPAFTSISDILSGSRISLNTAVRDVKVGGRSLNGALTLEASTDGTVAEINTLALTAEGLRLSYVGTVDYADLIPIGKLQLQDAGDGSELALMVFDHHPGSSSFDYHLSSPLLEETKFYGRVNWADSSAISSDAVLETPYLEGDLELAATLRFDPLDLSVRSNMLDLDLLLEDGMLSADGEIKHLSVNVTDSVSVTLDTLLNAWYGLEGSGFGVSLSNLAFKVSDLFSASLDLYFTDKSIRVENIGLERGRRNERFTGKADFTFRSLDSLLKLETDGLEGSVDLESTDGDISVKGAATDNQFYLDMKYTSKSASGMKASFSALGQRRNAIHVMSSLSWGEDNANNIVLNAMYNDLTVSVFDSYGNLGSLNLEDIRLDMDLRSMTVDGAVNLVNRIPRRAGGYSVQKALVTLSAKGGSISDNLMQVFSGKDYSFDFTLGISDVQLEDGYEIADMMIDMVLNKAGLFFSGNLVNGSFNLQTGYLDVSFDRQLLFGFNARGYIGDELDIMISDLTFPLPVLNQLFNSTTFSFKDGTVEGDVLVRGTLSNPSLYGMAYCRSYEMKLFYLPDQIISVKNVAVSFHDQELTVSRTPLAGYSNSDGRYFYGDVGVDMVLQGTSVESFDVDININESTPVYFWLPMYFGTDLEAKGDVSGHIVLSLAGQRSKLTTDLRISSMLIDFRFDEEMPDWFYASSSGIDLDVTMTTGKDVEFYYPEKDNSFINFTLAEDKTVKLKTSDGTISTDGGISLKTGQVYYFHNDFIIKEGSVDLTEKNLISESGSSMPIVLNLTAEITDYDQDGNKVVISMILQNATLDNLSPRFTSVPLKSENEILAMLGQSVLASGALDQNLSLSSLATFAATATETLTRVGMLESNKNYSISGTVRSALGLDIFSARSNILSNIIIDALPGELAGRGDISLLARYLDGTSLFAGKYIGLDWFIKVRLMLKADNRAKFSSNVGNFLSKDLILDTEISLDWDTALGTWSVFTNPRELSVFDILDTIGFSVTKQIQF